MEYYNYADLKNFIYDGDLMDLLCVNNDFSDLSTNLLKDDFLIIDETVKIPFFAETRDYVGARKNDNPDMVWIVKPIKDDEVLKTEMATICFFLDFYTHSISAPIVITKINNVLFKATKLILKAEQLTGANYTENRQLREIYYDEDRNPNNYMIKYNSRNDQIVIAIDFLNVDLLSNELKIEGSSDRFGWERKGKTRYLTPLKSENCLNYDMNFFNMRFNFFKKLDFKLLRDICNDLLRFNPDRKHLGENIADNLIRRADYVYNYFNSHICSNIERGMEEKYRDMGKTFSRIYDKNK